MITEITLRFPHKTGSTIGRLMAPSCLFQRETQCPNSYIGTDYSLTCDVPAHDQLTCSFLKCGKNKYTRIKRDLFRNCYYYFSHFQNLIYLNTRLLDHSLTTSGLLEEIRLWLVIRLNWAME